MSDGEFSVYQFFEDDSCECVRQGVDAEEAVKASRHYASSFGAQLGMTRRVIITTGDDAICFEWLFGEGITYPKECARPWPVKA